MQRLAFAPVVAGVLALGGCASYTAIEGSDYSVNTPLFRASVPVGTTTGPRQKRLQLSLAHLETDFSDGVKAGETAALSGTEFHGPTTLKGQAFFTTAHVGVVFPIPFRDNTMRLEANAGGAMIDSQIKISDSATDARLDLRRYGPSGGIALIVSTADQRFGVRAGVDHTWGQEVMVMESELLGVFAPTPSVEFLFGYRNFEYDLTERNNSDVDLTFSGPAAGIHIRF